MLQLKQFLETIYPVSETTWKQVQPLFSQEKLKKGGYFIDQGQIATRFGFLKSGVMRAFYRDSKGREYNKHFFLASSIVGGYSSLITGKPNQFIQEALTDCELLTAEYSSFTDLYDSFPDLERCGRRFAEMYFVQKERKELEIILLDAEARYLIFQKDHPGIDQLISQYHIASYLGISPTQLSRVRNKLARS